ncbi:MAG: CPBP family intramembrane metalloprotease [Flavobacteriaceae bacterium]|jgi:hypothetical protein|nr:CPBP family intramembrane metalloprotease [Flavobacteriaceae bacterium]
MKKIIVFISISYVISGIFGIIIWNLPKTESLINPLQMLFSVLLMTTPAFTAFLVERKKFSEITKKFQLNFKTINWKQTFKYLLITNLLLPVLVIFYGYVLGNVLEINVFGKLPTDYTQLHPMIQNTPIVKTDYFLPVLILIIFIYSSLLSISINGLIAMGEEIGWRGFLESNINLPFFKKNILIGIIWGIWHAPIIILCGHNYPSYPYWGILMMVISCISLSFYFSFALKNTRSLFVMGALHGGINAVIPMLATVQINYNEIFGPVGLLSVLSVLTIFTIDYTLNPKKIYA